VKTLVTFVLFFTFVSPSFAQPDAFDRMLQSVERMNKSLDRMGEELKNMQREIDEIKRELDGIKKQSGKTHKPDKEAEKNGMLWKPKQDPIAQRPSKRCY
jgi:peptidoglycan hydrolase CwlO-like protein